MKEGPQISFIIPVYNVERYLRKCVDSVLTQDYDDYEIILIDDGSPDKCPIICDEYAAKYSCINVIHQINSGLSVARNTGVAAAKGQYICFVDSDDFWEPNVLGSLLKQIEEEQLDVLRFDYQRVRLNSEGEYELYPKEKSSHIVDQRTDIVRGETYLAERMDYDCYAVQFVIRREMVQEFTPNIHFEDAEWLPRMMLHAQRVNCTSMMVYNYVIREDSITQSMDTPDKVRKNIEGKMSGIRTFSTLFDKHPYLCWLNNMRSLNAYYILCSATVLPYSEGKIYINQLREYNVFPLKWTNMRGKSIRKVAFINKWGPELYCIVMRFKYLLKCE